MKTTEMIPETYIKNTEGGLPFAPCTPWNRGDKHPTLPLTVIGVVNNRPVLVWYHDQTKCWHDNPAAFGNVPVEWWQYLPDCELLKANVQGDGSPDTNTQPT